MEQDRRHYQASTSNVTVHNQLN